MKEGAGNAGCSMHPQPRVQIKKRRTRTYKVHRNHTGIPCAMVLTAPPWSHEQNWQRAKGFLAAASVVFAVIEVAVEAWHRR